MARHIVDERLDDPASYLTVVPGDRVYDLYGWAVGRVVEPRLTPEDEQFDGIVVDFRGRHVFVDAPEVRAIHRGVVQLGTTTADVAQVPFDRSAPSQWPNGPPSCTARDAAAPASHDDAVALRIQRSQPAPMARTAEAPIAAKVCARTAAGVIKRIRLRKDIRSVIPSTWSRPRTHTREVLQ